MMWCGVASRYRGHASVKTIKDVAFVGPNQSMVAAGSDDGRMFIWDRYTGEGQQHLHSPCTALSGASMQPCTPLYLFT